MLQLAIENEIEKLKARLVRLEQLVRPIPPENAIGRLSRFEAIGEKGVNETALLNGRNLLHQLETALSRAGDPEFGYCEECGDKITVGRLLVMPSSPRCVYCAKDLE